MSPAQDAGVLEILVEDEVRESDPDDQSDGQQDESCYYDSKPEDPGRHSFDNRLNRSLIPAARSSDLTSRMHVIELRIVNSILTFRSTTHRIQRQPFTCHHCTVR